MAFKSAAIFSLLSTALSVWFTFYENLIYVEKLQLPILSAITIILIIYMTIGFTNSSKVSKNDLRYLGIHQGPLTERAEKARLRKHLNKFKLIYFVIFIPFFLLLLKFEKKYFYSIVYDASASMLSSLDNTRYYLNQNINNLDVDADFMISTIPGESNTKTVKRRYKLFGEIEDWPYVKKGSIKAFKKDSLSKIVNVKSSQNYSVMMCRWNLFLISLTTLTMLNSVQKKQVHLFQNWFGVILLSQLDIQKHFTIRKN